MGFSLSHNAELNSLERCSAGADTLMSIQDFDASMSIQDNPANVNSGRCRADINLEQQKVIPEHFNHEYRLSTDDGQNKRTLPNHQYNNSRLGMD